MNIPFKQCENCEEILYASKYHCKSCYSEELKTIEIDGKGKIYSFTKIYAAPTQFADQAPYYVILVQLDKGIKITGRIKGEIVQIGQSVVLDEIIENCYYFKPILR